MFRSKRRTHPLFVEDEAISPPQARRLRLRYVLLLMVISLASAAYWQRAEASMGEISSMDEVKAGQLLLKTGENNRFLPAVTQASKVHISVSGMVAHVTVEQRFLNSGGEWAEGVYAFPLPDKAAVNRMRISIGERVIEGEIKEKEQAKNIYQAARRAGKKAGLVSQQRPNLFKTSVANIPPGETVTVQLDYIESINYDHGRFSLRFPMTITPRYIPGVPLKAITAERETPLITGWTGWAANTDQVPDAADITPWLNPVVPSANHPINPIELTAEIDMGMPLRNIESAYHNIVLSRKEHRYDVVLNEGTVSMEQDFVISWRPLTGSEPTAAVFSEQVKGEDYALLMLLPPENTSAASTLPKETIYIIDTSGSMDGVSIKQARQSLLYALDQLSPGDRFNVIAFNSTTHSLFDQAVEASVDHLNYARKYVRALRSGGGTEMLPALQAAFNHDAEEGYVRQVIFITDGAVGNEVTLFNAIHRQLGNSRLYTIGIGSAPNSHFMRKAAQFGRGTFTHIAEVSEVQQKMTELFSKLESPVVTDIAVSWPGGTGSESYPNRIPDLYRGEPLLVSVKMQDIRGTVSVSGRTAGEQWQQHIHINAVNNHAGAATLWAREKIASLLDEKIAGGDADAVRSAVIDVALTHQLVSPYTSFVAVEQKVSRPGGKPLQPSAVANARPKGQGPQRYAYPKTASGAGQSLVWGVLLILMAWTFNHCVRKESEYGLLG